MKNIPKKIYLQIDSENCEYFKELEDFKELDEVTWCDERINKTDIEFELINHFREEIESMTAKKLARMDYDEIDNWIETNL